MPTVSAHVAHRLAEHVGAVFGVMGNGNAYFLDALVRATSTPYLAMRHEAGAVAAADAHFRAGGGLAAATTTFGPGFTNTLTALAEAAQARIPLVLVTGDAPTTGFRPWDVDQSALAALAGVRTFSVGLDDAAAVTTRAIEAALAYRVPTVLAIPHDHGARDAGPLTAGTPLRRPAAVAPDSPLAQQTIREFAAALAGARHPLILAGRGAWLANAGAALGRLADATGAVTTTTALARGLFPRTEFDLGVAGGFGAEGAMELVQHADVAVVFGASLTQFTMRFGELFAPTTRVLQVDVAPAATHPVVAGYLCGDAALVAAAMTTELAAIGAVSSGWRETIDVTPLLARESGEGTAPDGRLDPREVARRIGELLPEDRVVVSDGGHFIGWANMYWPVAAPDRLMMVGTAFQTIGLGLPSVAGAAQAKPDSTIVLTSGDGGALMALADLESAARIAGGRGLAVIWNDAVYGAEVNLYGLKGLAEGPMRVGEADFATVARGVGAEGVVVRHLEDLDYLAEWASRPSATRQFLVLDVRITPDVIAPYQREIIRVNS